MSYVSKTTVRIIQKDDVNGVHASVENVVVWVGY